MAQATAAPKSVSQFGEIKTRLLDHVDQRWNRSTPLSFLYILYACESVSFTTELEKGRQDFEMLPKLLNISYKDHKPMKRLAERFKQPVKDMVNSSAWLKDRNEGCSKT